MTHIVCPLCEWHEARQEIKSIPRCYKCDTQMVLDPEYTQEPPEFDGYVFDLDNDYPLDRQDGDEDEDTAGY